VSERRQIERRIRQSGEIRSILASMRSLALLESRRLARLLETQGEAVAEIGRVAADFLADHPEARAAPPDGRRAWLVVGSERGFCGNFNEAVLAPLGREPRAAGDDPIVVAVGRRLLDRLATPPAAAVAGAGIAQEVGPVLQEVVREVAALQARHGPLALTAVFHDREPQRVVTRALLPPFHDLAPPARRRPHPADLDLAPPDLAEALADHYVFAALHELYFASLMAENRRRAEHLDGAVRHLDEAGADLARRRNVLRQEEITEEIEVILLSAADVPVAARSRRTARRRD
jgi:F-type H+-transporting ATPase subunit gamma